MINKRLFYNKAETLIYLKDKLSLSNISDLFLFSVCEYKKDPDTVFSKIASIFCDKIIIRSSASAEDQSSTNAGHFSSAGYIDSQKRSSVIAGIDKVIRSYEKDALSDSEIIFVQEQLTDVLIAGVTLSFVPNSGKPYYLVNYDDSGSTNSVTSGKCKQYMYIARDFIHSDCLESKLCRAFLEIETCCNERYLDIEFAVTTKGEINIFQVRRLITNSSSVELQSIFNRKNFFSSNFSKKPELLSDMAFWNPSEIIGDSPRPLDYSLYDYLVTNHAWNKGIAEIGFYPTSDTLMLKIGNKPYIKLKTAFHSLIPAAIKGELRERLVNHYSQIIINNKNLHDKIEFEIVHNCYDFNTDKKLAALSEHGFSDSDIANIAKALYENTRSIIEGYDGILSNDLQKLMILEKTLENCKKNIRINEINSILGTISEILPVLRDYGVVPFACQARCAFIARSLCISMIDTGQMDYETIDTFMHSIRSITGELQADTVRFNTGELDKDYMNNKYGHLRSHSYDITSPTYSEIGVEKIFTAIDNKRHEVNEHSELNILFPKTQINLTKFISTAIAQREHFKFIFTRALSFVLDLISKLASYMNLTREDIAYSTIESILQLKNLHEEINKNKQDYDLDSSLILPSVISCPNDFNVVRVNESVPNFITNHCTEGEVLVINGLSYKKPDVSGKIVVIQYADPGYDWIFAAGSLAGLITQYGGMASHMAIRCMEFDIPAAIGCGELIYNQIAQSERITLDCPAKRVVVNR